MCVKNLNNWLKSMSIDYRNARITMQLSMAKVIGCTPHTVLTPPYPRGWWKRTYEMENTATAGKKRPRNRSTNDDDDSIEGSSNSPVIKMFTVS